MNAQGFRRLTSYSLALLALVAAACSNETSLFDAGDDDDGGQPGACPPSTPSGACADEGLACTYPGVCGGALAECVSGRWQVSEDDCVDPGPFTCPAALPLGGNSCLEAGNGNEGLCTYTVETACGITQVDARCERDPVATDVRWVIEAPPCASAACGSYAQKDLCDADTGCRWLQPGCGSDPFIDFVEGCYPAEDCTDDTSCNDDEACSPILFDPCAFSSCNVCFDEADICLPPPNDG
ncbi:MAG: hypothetical protein AAF715_14940 [Myxococcota bacterium]